MFNLESCVRQKQHADQGIGRDHPAVKRMAAVEDSMNHMLYEMQKKNLPPGTTFEEFMLTLRNPPPDILDKLGFGIRTGPENQNNIIDSHFVESESEQLPTPKKK